MVFELDRRLSLKSVFSRSSSAISQESMISNSKEAIVRILVEAVSDSSPQVKQSAMDSLKEENVLRENGPVIVETCLEVLQRGRKRGSIHGVYVAGLLSVLSTSVRQMKRESLTPSLLHDVARVAIREMASTRDIECDSQIAASNLLVSVGLQDADMMFLEAFTPPPGFYLPIACVVRSLAKFSELDAPSMVSGLKPVLSRILPVLGKIQKGHRYIFAQAIGVWSESLTQERLPLDPEILAEFRSVFELFFTDWISTSDKQVSAAVVEALGRMALLIGRPQLKSFLPPLLQSLMGMYKRSDVEHRLVSRGIRLIVHASLDAQHGEQVADFQGLHPVISCLLTKASPVRLKGISAESPEAALKNCNEVLGCFTTIGKAFPADMCALLMQKLAHGDDQAKLGALAVLRHLIFWLSRDWESKQRSIAGFVRGALVEEDVNIRKELAQVILAMAANHYLNAENVESFVKFLVYHCGSDGESSQDGDSGSSSSSSVVASAYSKHQVRLGLASSAELSAVCQMALHLMSTTLPHLRAALFPIFLKVLVPRRYAGSIGTVCLCLSDMHRHGFRPSLLNPAPNSIPPPQVLLARLVILLESPLLNCSRTLNILRVLHILEPYFHNQATDRWSSQIWKMEAFLAPKSSTSHSSNLEMQAHTWNELVMELLMLSFEVRPTQEWAMLMANSLSSLYDLYKSGRTQMALLHRCLGLTVQHVRNTPFVTEKINYMYGKARIADCQDREGIAMGMGLVAATHIDVVLLKLGSILETEGRSWIRWLLSFLSGRKRPSADDVCASLALMYGYVASYAPADVLEARIDSLVGTNVLTHLVLVYSPEAKQAVTSAINLLAKAVRHSYSEHIVFPLKQRNAMVGYVLNYMDAGYFGSPLDARHLKLQAHCLAAVKNLVLVEPPLEVVIRDRIIQAALPFVLLPLQPSYLVDQVTGNLTALLCSLLSKSRHHGERLELLYNLLLQVGRYSCSQDEGHRLRCCVLAQALLNQVHLLCSHGSDVVSEVSSVGSSNEEGISQVGDGLMEQPELRLSLQIGRLLAAFLPRCADSSKLIKSEAIKVLCLLFDVGLLFSHRDSHHDRQASSAALRVLQTFIRTTAQDENKQLLTDVFRKVVAAIGILVLDSELNMYLLHVAASMADRDTPALLGAISSASHFILLRGHQLTAPTVTAVVHDLLVAVPLVSDTSVQREMTGLILLLAEHARADVTFSVLLSVLEEQQQQPGLRSRRLLTTVNETLEMICGSSILVRPMLDYLVSVVEKAQLYSLGGEASLSPAGGQHVLNPIPQAATVALGIALRTLGTSASSGVNSRYTSIFCALILRLGAVHSIATTSSNLQPAKELLHAILAFSDSTVDLKMKEAALRMEAEALPGARWFECAADLAAAQSSSYPSHVSEICTHLITLLDEPRIEDERIAIATCLALYAQKCSDDDSLQAMLACLTQLSRDSQPVIRTAAMKGLVNMKDGFVAQHGSQILSVSITLSSDSDPKAALMAVCSVPKLLRLASEQVEEAASTLFTILCTLQESTVDEMRAAAFIALGSLLDNVSLASTHDFHNEIYASLARVLLHTNDDSSIVRAAAKKCLLSMRPFLPSEEMSTLLASSFCKLDQQWQFEEFLVSFVEQLAHSHADKMEMFMDPIFEMMDSSPWASIQGSAILFCAYFLRSVSSGDADMYLSRANLVITALIHGSRNSSVQARATTGISVILTLLT